MNTTSLRITLATALLLAAGTASAGKVNCAGNLVIHASTRMQANGTEDQVLTVSNVSKIQTAFSISPLRVPAEIKWAGGHIQGNLKPGELKVYTWGNSPSKRTPPDIIMDGKSGNTFAMMATSCAQPVLM